MNVAIVSANLGRFDTPTYDEEQQLPPDIEQLVFQRFTDNSYPPRLNSMTPRLQARIVKTHMWEFMPDYGYYLWIDSSCRLSNPNSVKWFLEQLGDADMAVFKHPHRNTVQEEADYLKHRLSIGCPYITPRYAGEDIDGQLAVVDPQAELYASTAFIYKDSLMVRNAMRDWWYQISRYHSIDQLSLPHAIRNLAVNVIPDNYLKSEFIEYVRNK